MSYSENSQPFFFNNPRYSLLISRLHDQREAGLFCDVILHVGSETYAAHRNLLAASSLYFESMFLEESTKEKEGSRDDKNGLIQVTIDTVSVCPNTFLAVLKYLYLGHISVEAMCVTDVLKLAEKFYLDSLIECCKAYLERRCRSKTENSTADKHEITEEASTGDCFQTGFTLAFSLDELKYEIKSEEIESKCDSLSNEQMPIVIYKSKRQYRKCRNENLVRQKRISPDAQKFAVNDELPVLVRESASTDYQIGDRISRPSEMNLAKSGHTILQKSAREKLVRSNCLRRKMTNHNLPVKLKLNTSVTSSQSNQTLASSAMSDVDETCMPDLKIKMKGKVVDALQDCNRAMLKSIKEIQPVGTNNGRRRKGRSVKKSSKAEGFPAASRNATRISCFWCSYRCQWKRELSDHAATFHFPESSYNCDKCSETFDEVESLLKHRKSHVLLERRFECNVCKKRFKVKNALTQHMLWHNGEKTFMCAVCGRSFMTKAILNDHVLTHSEHRPWLCHLCDFSSHYKSLLSEHQRVHNGGMFRCELPDCDYSATRRSRITTHMRSHLKIRQHVCSTCAKSFINRSHLVRHERLHLDARPFKCDHCSVAFSRVDYLRRHRKKCCLDA